jgi:hypothetical protein
MERERLREIEERRRGIFTDQSGSRVTTRSQSVHQQQQESQQQQQQQQQEEEEEEEVQSDQSENVNISHQSSNDEREESEEEEDTPLLVPKFVEIKTKEQHHMNGRVHSKKIHLNVLMPGSEEVQSISLLEIMNSFQRALHQVLQKALKDSSPADWVQVVIKTPNLQHPISTRLILRSNFSVHHVLAVIQDRAQSSFDLSIGDGVEVDVIVVKKKGTISDRKTAGCRRAGLKRKRSKRTMIVSVDNSDNMCLARSVAVCLSFLIEHTPSPGADLIELWELISESPFRPPIQKFRYLEVRKGDSDRRVSQRDMARRICNLSGIDQKSACGIGEIQKIENALKIRINVVDESSFNSFIYHGSFLFSPSCNIYLLREQSDSESGYHFNAITDIRGYFRQKYFCHHCNVSYAEITQHRCSDVDDWCYSCYNRFCQHDSAFRHERCDVCNRVFRSESCKMNHKKLRNVRCLKVMCSACHQIIPREKKSDGTYESSFEVLSRHGKCNISCDVCNEQNISPSHECYMQSVPFKDHVKKVVYLDFESHQENGVHVPIYCYLKWKFENGDEIEIDEHEIGLERDISDELGDFLFSQKFEGSTILAHNMRAYDGCFLLQYLIRKNVKPERMIVNGTKLLTWYVPKFKIRIIDSLNFLPMSLGEMPKAFGLNLSTFKKGHFPHFFSSPDRFDYVGEFPPKKDFGYETMKKKQQEEFDQWYEEKMRENAVFNFTEEMKIYCKQDVEILFQGFEKFRSLVKELSSELLQEKSNLKKISKIPTSSTMFSSENDSEQEDDHDDDDDDDVVSSCDPLSYITLAGLCHAIFKACFLEKKTIALVPPGGYGNHNFSNKQIEFLEYIRRTRAPNLKHRFNSSTGECRIGDFRVDGFDETTNSIFEFNGCFFHGHEKCVKNMDHLNPVSKISYRQLLKNTQDRADYFSALGYNVISVWECEWENFKKEHENDEILKNVLECVVGMLPIDPRDAFRGGRTETFKMIAENVEMRYVDVNSLYPFILLAKCFPVGHPEILLQFENTEIENFFGFIKCSILPPRKLYHPVLPVSMNGKLLFPLCSTCAKHSSKTKCTHSDEERSLSGTWFSEELKSAIEKGYVVQKIFQVMNFKWKSSDLFKGYVKTFYKLKLMASGIPHDLSSKEEVQQFLQDVKTRDGIELKEEDFENPNPARRWLTKIMLNSFFGRFGMKEDKKKVEFITSDRDLDRLLYEPNFEITAVIPQTESVVLVAYEYRNKDVIPMSNNTNVYIAAATTALARMELFKYLDLLSFDEGEKSNAYYVDTDSAFYTISGSQNPLPEGRHLGDLTNELQPGEFITHFVSGGPKNYAYRTNLNNECVKVKGFSLHAANRNVFTMENMKNLVECFVSENEHDDGRVEFIGDKKKKDKEIREKARAMHDGENDDDFRGSVFVPNEAISCLNPRKITRSKTWELVNREELKIHRFYFDKRVVQSNFDTLPYGY